MQKLDNGKSLDLLVNTVIKISAPPPHTHHTHARAHTHTTHTGMSIQSNESVKQ